jgi:hypothetical protein
MLRIRTRGAEPGRISSRVEAIHASQEIVMFSEPTGVAITATFFALLLLVGLVAIRTLSAGKIEVKLTDAAIAVIPMLVWLLASGQVSKLVVGTEGITVETTRMAILEAADRPIENQVSPLPVAPVEIAVKGSVGDIPALVAKGIAALEFQLGFGGYVGDVIREYFAALTATPTFRYVVITNRDGTLFGIMDAHRLAAALGNRSGPASWEDFAQILERNDAAGIANLGAAAAFVAAGSAVSAMADKRMVLEQMEKLNADWLPVIDENRKFAGVVDRSRVVASLILEVDTRLRSS